MSPARRAPRGAAESATAHSAGPVLPLPGGNDPIAHLEAMLRRARLRRRGLLSIKQGRPVQLGGRPLPILRALAVDQPVGILHFDAHADTLDEICGDKVNHATFMRRGYEEGLIDPKRAIQVGMRGSRFTPEDIQYGYDVGYSIITMDEYEEMGRAAAIEQIHQVLAGGPVYISLDIDGLDPAYLPGTGVPEIGGLIPRDVQVILRSLQGMDIVGADISEVSPGYDPTGITCVTVANLMFEMLCIIADSICAKR